jgi:uncharacterized repeat protein (TIGR01451 family)
MTERRTARPAASTRRVVTRVAIAVLLVALAIGAAAATGGNAAGPTVTIAKTGTPASVTGGYNVLYTITVTNGSTAANHVTISDPAVGKTLPAGTKFLKATIDRGTCPAVTPTTTSITCDAGSLAARQVVKMKVVLTIPATLAGSTFINTASTKLNEGFSDTNPQSSHQDTFETSADTSVLALGNANEAQGYFETPCNPDAANDPSRIFTNQSLGTGNVQSTDACIPDFGAGTTVSLKEKPHANSDKGFSETSEICVPTTPGGPCSAPLTFSTPAIFKFRISPLEFPTPTFNYKKLIVFHDGKEVTTLCGSDGSLPSGASACKFEPTEDKDTGVVTQLVKSLSNGTWQFGP